MEESEPVPAGSLSLLAPVPAPGKIVCVGLNYRDHAAETGKPIPTEPVLFAKFANSVVGDGARVAIPAATAEADWEAELGVVIGREATRVSAEHALAHVAGYLCANDLSARDLQRSGGQWTRGKAIDGFLPMGPVLVTADEVPDPQQLRHPVHAQRRGGAGLLHLADGLRGRRADQRDQPDHDPRAGGRHPTGTPPGVGMAMTPPRFLREGDVLEVEIDRLGRLVTTMAGPAA